MLYWLQQRLCAKCAVGVNVENEASLQKALNSFEAAMK
jgi:hypothetical protein